MIAPRKPLAAITEPEDKDAFLRLLMAVAANAVNDPESMANELPYFMPFLQTAWADKPITEALLRETMEDIYKKGHAPETIKGTHHYYSEILVMTFKSFLSGLRSPYDDMGPETGQSGHSL